MICQTFFSFLAVSLPRYHAISLIILFFTLPLLSGFAQIDTEFWFVGPEASENHGERPVYIRICTLDEPSNITLRMPANNKFVPVKNLVPANSTFSVRIDNIAGDLTWLDSIENRPPDVILHKGFLLTADKYITAYYEINNASNPAIFPFKGRNAVGTEFFVPGQNNYVNQVNDGSEAFDIIATRDTTTITITPAIDIVGHPANVPFQIVLNKGETYSARTLNTSSNATLAGSHIVSDKPIAITISDDSIVTGGWDIIGDQIVPVNLLGYEYIAIKGYADNNPPGNNDERVYILATQDGTEIRIDGNPVPVATINTGEQYNYDIPQSTNTAVVKASKPVYVYHLTGHPGEAGASILPHDSCTGSQKVGFNRSSTSAFAMMILTRTGNEGSFQLNGNNSIITAPEFNPVPGTNGNWMYFRQNNMSTGDVPLDGNLLENSNGKFHLGILNNVGASSEYGYFSDFSTLYLGADASMCPGDSVVLDAGPFRDTYEWKKLIAGLWSTVGTGQTFICYDTGFFACMTDGDFCTLYDTIRVQYYPNASVSIGPDRTICEGTTTTLVPGNYQSYEWSDGSNSPTFTTGNYGNVWVRVTNINGCMAHDTVMILVDSLPFSNHPVVGPGTVCQGQLPTAYSVLPLKYATSYQWVLPSGWLGASTTSLIDITFSNSAISGNISVKGVNSCGSGSEIFLPIVVNPLPSDPGLITAPESMCQGQNGITFSVIPVPFANSYTWTLPAGISMASPPGNSITANAGTTATSGNIVIKGVNNCGEGPSSTSFLVVNNLPVMPGSISGPSGICQGQSAVPFSIAPVPGADSYLWTFPAGVSITGGAGTATVEILADSASVSGTITVIGHNNLCGDGPATTRALTINPLPSPAGIISGISPVCQGLQGIVYAIQPLQNTTTYSWVLPSGVLPLSGVNTASITVATSSNALTGLMEVQGHNSVCGYGRKSKLLLEINPLPIIPGTITGTNTVCQGDSQTQFSISPGDPNTSVYLWSLNPGSSGTITGNTTNINIDWSNAYTGKSNLVVKGNNNCGDGPSSLPLEISVNYRPVVTFQACSDLQTTKNGRPIILRGGFPAGGTGIYTGSGVQQDGSGNWIFQPLSGAITGSVQGTPYTITYRYTNFYNCSSEAGQVIRVYPSNAGQSCPGTLTDVRDGKTYPTFLAGFGAGSKCWMAANLDFGNWISDTQPQRDNCINEKYCAGNLSANCNESGGFYQWMELVNYNPVAGSQGICPPGWHIPTEAEWETMLKAIAAGITPPVDGVAGGFLKDQSLPNGFHSFTKGVNYLNSSWWFQNEPITGTFYWTSSQSSSFRVETRGLINKNPSVSSYNSSIGNALNVRCIQD